MKPAEQLGTPRPLTEWITQLGSLPADGWLVVRQDVVDITGDLSCWPKLVSSRDLTDEEFDAFESWLARNGYKGFLNQSQLEDITSNLDQQQPNSSARDQIRAIDYYWKNDAFLVIEQP